MSSDSTKNFENQRPQSGEIVITLCDENGYGYVAGVDKFGAFLRRWREQKNWSVHQLSDETGIPHGTWSKWETYDDARRLHPASRARLEGIVGATIRERFWPNELDDHHERDDAQIIMLVEFIAKALDSSPRLEQ